MWQFCEFHTVLLLSFRYRCKHSNLGFPTCYIWICITWYEDHATRRVHLYLTSVSRIKFQFCSGFVVFSWVLFCSGICCVQLCFSCSICFTQTNKFFTPTDLLDSSHTDFGFKQTKTEPQSPRLHMYESIAKLMC